MKILNLLKYLKLKKIKKIISKFSGNFFYLA